MARWVKVEKVTGKLVNAIAGFEKGEENYDLCLQFASSNFKYHRFLDVDSHKISRALDGIHEKFDVHSRHLEAEKFKALTDSFLSSPVFEGKSEGKTDTHYALLSLLLSLADSPTQATYRESTLVRSEEEADNFDWGAYLLEGLEPLGPYPQSPVWSEDEEEEQAPADQQMAPVSMDDSGITADDHLPSCSSSLATVDTGQSWLTRNVVVQYWTGQVDHAGHSYQFSASLARDMDSFLRNSSLFYNYKGTTLLTETQVIREVLWLLTGVTSSYVFTMNQDGKFVVRDGLKLSHLTQESLMALLKRVAAFGDIVLQLKNFVEEVLMNSFHGDRAVSQTHQAYASTIATYLQNLKEQLIGIEKRVIAQDETLTLLSLTLDLRRRFYELEILHAVHQKGVIDCRGSHSQRASHLLSTLYDAICEYDTAGEEGMETVSILLPLWLQTAKPYIDIIDQWITNGRLVDPVQEFIIQRNENVKSLDEKFWETAFSLHCSPTVDGASSSEGSTLEGTSHQDGTTQSDEQTYRKSSWAPTFLQPVLGHVIFAGKSMEMLQSLGRLLDVIDAGSHPKPLYDTFLDNLHTFLREELETHSKESEGTRTVTDNALSVTAHVSQQMLVKGTNDPLLRVNFAAIFRVGAEVVMETEKDKYNFSDMSSGESLKPLQVALRHCLYPRITEKYHRVCTKLLDILKSEYDMLHYMEIMRNFFLMEAGDTMYDFYREIFLKLQLHEPWQDMSFLNVALHDTLQTHFPQEADKLFVSVQPASEKGRDRHPIQALDGLTLHYKVPWPVDVVINTRCQEIYNKIFQFLLQIKRAKFCLDRLKFDDLEKPDPYAEQSGENIEKTQQRDFIHRMQVFRLRLMHFVNSLHQYVMTRILHSTGLEFQSEVNQAKDLDQVISIHTNYVKKIHERCLLHKRVAMIKETVTRVLNIAVGFQEVWNSGKDNLSDKYLKHVEDEFRNCVKFLTSFLNNVIKRGSFPHLESLAFSLSTSLEQHQTR